VNLGSVQPAIQDKNLDQFVECSTVVFKDTASTLYLDLEHLLDTSAEHWSKLRA